MKKRVLPFILGLLLVITIIPATPVMARDVGNITGNARSTYDGFDWEFWSQNRNDGGHMALTGGGTFVCSWENTENILFRMGKRLGSVSTYKEYGDIILEYVATHNVTRGNASYLTVYGWTQNPLIEWYVVENYGSYNPGSAGTLKGTFTVDGGTYDVYEATRTQQPSIEGTRTFQQYFSVRREKRTAGTITLHEHFAAWEEFGLDMSGNLYEVMLCIEGFRTSGNGSVTTHVLTIGDTVYGTFPETSEIPEIPEIPKIPEIPEPEPITPPTPDSGFTTSDALNILKSTVGSGTLTDEHIEKYDVNEDGKVDLSDALAILKIVAGGR